MKCIHSINRTKVFHLSILLFGLIGCSQKITTEQIRETKNQPTKTEQNKKEIIHFPYDLNGVYYLLQSTENVEAINTDIGILIEGNTSNSKVTISLGGDYFFFKNCRNYAKKNFVTIACKKVKPFRIRFIDPNQIVYENGPSIPKPMDPNEPNKIQGVELMFQTETQFYRSTNDLGQLSDFMMRSMAN